MTDTFTKTERSRIMAAVKAENTGPEMIVRRMVHAMGFRYRLHVRDLPGTPDMVFPRLRKIINIHGCFWHLHECSRCRVPATRRRYWTAKLQRNAERDKQVCRKLRREGWHVLSSGNAKRRPKNGSRSAGESKSFWLNYPSRKDNLAFCYANAYPTALTSVQNPHYDPLPAG